MGRTIVVGIALAAGLAAISSRAAAATLRVPSQYGTIQAAVDAATLGDIVLVAQGVYTPAAPIFLYMKKNVRLAGESGRDLTVLNGNIDINTSSSISVAGLTINGSVRIACNVGTVVSSCIIQHSAGSGVVVSGCPSGAYSEVEISGNVIRENAGDGIEAELSGGQATFGGNDISGNGRSGIYVLHSYCEISGNVIHDNGTNGVSIDQATSSIIGNTTARNAAFGVSIATAGSPRTQTIARNVIATNRTGGVYGDAVAAHVISCNDVWGNSAGPGGDYSGHIGDQTGLNGNISENPLFCGATEGDFSLGTGSPALSQECGAMGALEEPGCAAPVSVRTATWGGIKSFYR
jgi:serine protease